MIFLNIICILIVGKPQYNTKRCLCVKLATKIGARKKHCSNAKKYAELLERLSEWIHILCVQRAVKTYERYTIIAPILQLLPDEQKKCEMISVIAISEEISKQTVQKRL